MLLIQRIEESCIIRFAKHKTNDFEEPLTFRLNNPTANKVVVYLSCTEFNAHRFVLIEDFFIDNTFDKSISRLAFGKRFFNTRKSVEKKVNVKIVNNEDVGWYEVGFRSRRVLGDSAFYAIVGYSEEEIGTLDQLREIVAPGECERLKQILNTGDKDIDATFKILDKNGKLKSIRIIGEVVIDVDGVIRYFLGCVVKISDSIQLENKLNRIQNLSRVGWVDLDILSGDFYCSKECRKIFGFQGLEGIKNLSELSDFVIEQDQDLLNQIEVIYADPMVTVWNDIQFRIMTHGGVLKNVLCHGEILRDSEGQAVKTLVTLQDVTEHRVMQDKLERAQKISNTGWFEYDLLHPEVSKFSEQWLIMHDYHAGEIPTFENYISKLLPEDRGLFEDGLVNFLISMPESWDRIDYRLITSSGDRKYISNSSHIIYNKDEPVKVFGVTTDVTAFKNAQFELFKSEELHRLISETSRDVIVLLNGQSGKRRVNYISRSNESLLGYTDDQLIGVLAKDLIHPEDHRKYKIAYKNYLTNGDASLKVELRLKKYDQTYVWTEIIGNEIEIRHEKYLRLSIRDITDRRENMEALVRANNELNALITIKSNLIFAFDELGRFERVLGKEKLLHIPKEEFVGKPVEEIWSDENGRYMSKMVRESLKNGASQVFDCRHVGAGALGRWFRVSTHPYVSMGAKNKVCVVIEDITERNNFEHAIMSANSELKALIKATDNLIFAFDKEGSFERVIGDPDQLHMPADEFIGQKVEDVWNDPNGIEMAQMVRRSLGSGEEEEFECVVENEIGEKEYHKVTTHPYHGLDNQLKVCVIKEDVTLQRKYEEELKGMLNKERELSKMRASFVAMASHQFRTPLTVIKSNMQLVKAHGVENEIVNKVSDRLIREVDRLVALMEDILTLGKVQSQQLESNPSSFSIMEILNDVVGDVGCTDLERRELGIYQEGTSRNVLVDYDLLRHALINLIDNAFKYSRGSKAPEVYIDYGHGDEVELRVRDYGIGIPTDDLDRIFQDFYRSPNVKEIQGTGLGMSIAKEFLTINKCDLIVESEVDKGSVFTIRIPISQDKI